MKFRSRYLLVGIWNSIFGVSTFLVLSGLFGQEPDILILGISYGISIVQAHFSQRHFVWKTTTAYVPELLKFSTAYLLQFILNSALLISSEDLFDLSREVRQVIIVFLLTVFFYFINKRGVFRV